MGKEMSFVFVELYVFVGVVGVIDIFGLLNCDVIILFDVECVMKVIMSLKEKGLFISENGIIFVVF